MHPRAFWRYCNARVNPNTIPSLLSLDGESASTPDEQCNLFAKHFASVFVDPTTCPLSLSDGLTHTPSNIIPSFEVAIDEDVVAMAISKLKLSFSPGPDSIPSSVIKKCVLIFVPLLYRLFRKSLNSGSFPMLWKCAWLVPVHKKGKRTNAKNYRRVSLLCASAMIFEYVIHFSFLKRVVHYISPHQHGFMPK